MEQIFFLFEAEISMSFFEFFTGLAIISLARFLTKGFRPLSFLEKLNNDDAEREIGSVCVQ